MELPVELIIEILKYLDAPSLLAISQVNKNLHILAQQESLWKRLYLEEYEEKWKKGSWKCNYVDLSRLMRCNFTKLRKKKGKKLLKDVEWLYLEMENPMTPYRFSFGIFSMKKEPIDPDQIIFNKNILLVIPARGRISFNLLYAPITYHDLFITIQEQYDGCCGDQFEGLKKIKTKYGTIYIPQFS